MELTAQQQSIGFLVVTLFLCIPAFYNGAALLFPDSIGYVYSGFEGKIIPQRVWTYAGFIRHSSVNQTFWLTIWIQAILTTASLYWSFKYLFDQFRTSYFISYGILISSTTAVAFHCSRLMPDFLTPIMLLQLALFLFGRPMNKLDKLLAGLVFLLALSVHNSHIVIAVLLLLALGLAGVLPSVRTWYRACQITWKRWTQVVVLIVTSVLLVGTLHWSLGAGFQATKGGSLFLFARLCDFDIAQDYLEEHCQGDERPLCTTRNTLTHGSYFLWLDFSSSINQQGGWTTENEALYGTLVREMLTTPKYFVRYVQRSLETTFMQLACVEYSPLAEVEGKKIGNIIKWMFPQYPIALEGSKQEKGTYTNAEIAFGNQLQYAILFLSALLLLWFILYDKFSTRTKIVVLFVVFGLIVNAFVVAATSGVYDRYQSRIAWLLTLPAFWCGVQLLEQGFKRIIRSLPTDSLTTFYSQDPK